MDIINSLQRKYRQQIMIDFSDYSKAQKELSKEIFKREYGTDTDGYFKYTYPLEKELHLLMLDSINGKLKFFVAITLIGLCLILVLVLIGLF